jgi:hypothetical protein
MRERTVYVEFRGITCYTAIFKKVMGYTWK